MAVPTRVAAALTGATIGQLVYWRIGRGVYEPMLVPEYRAGKEWLYSFRDLIALRTVVYLRERVSLQKIREATRTLERIGDADHLSNYALYAPADSVVWAHPDGDHVDLVDQPGQLRAHAVMSDVFGPFRTDKGALVIPFREPFPHIEVDPELRGGYPVVAESRVPYHLVASLVRDGVPPDAIREIYPSVDADGARDAVRMADYMDRRTRAA